MGISINKKIFFIILLLFFLSGCTQDNNTELISGEMSEQEIDSFFGDLELASYTIENQHYSKKNGSQIMDTRMLFGISANEYKIKLETFTSGSEEELKGEAIIIAGTNQEGEITQIKKYDFCTETAILGRMCMDMTTMGEELSKNIREQGISSKNSSRETITKFVGFKEILGEKRDALKLIMPQKQKQLFVITQNILLV